MNKQQVKIFNNADGSIVTIMKEHYDFHNDGLNLKAFLSHIQFSDGYKTICLNFIPDNTIKISPEDLTISLSFDTSFSIQNRKKIEEDERFARGWQYILPIDELKPEETDKEIYHADIHCIFPKGIIELLYDISRPTSLYISKQLINKYNFFKYVQNFLMAIGEHSDLMHEFETRENNKPSQLYEFYKNKDGSEITLMNELYDFSDDGLHLKVAISRLTNSIEGYEELYLNFFPDDEDNFSLKNIKIGNTSSLICPQEFEIKKGNNKIYHTKYHCKLYPFDITDLFDLEKNYDLIINDIIIDKIKFFRYVYECFKNLFPKYCFEFDKFQTLTRTSITIEHQHFITYINPDNSVVTTMKESYDFSKDGLSMRGILFHVIHTYETSDTYISLIPNSDNFFQDNVKVQIIDKYGSHTLSTEDREDFHTKYFCYFSKWTIDELFNISDLEKYIAIEDIIIDKYNFFKYVNKFFDLLHLRISSLQEFQSKLTERERVEREIEEAEIIAQQKRDKQFAIFIRVIISLITLAVGLWLHFKIHEY